MNRATPIAIVGAGYAGLSCAVELALRGFPVSVFESSRTPGGRARVVTVGSLALDNGQHILLGAYRETQRLMRRVGANPDRLYASRSACTIRAKWIWSPRLSSRR